MAGPTLLDIRQFMAREAGPFHSGTTTSGTTTGALEDTSFPVKSTLSQDTLFKDMWAFMPSVTALDKVRIVKTYSPSAGTLTPDLAYSSAYTATPYELHGIFEPGTVIPLLINEGLKDILIPVEFTFTPSNSTYTRQSLASAAPWLTDPSWVLKVGCRTQGSQGRDIINPYDFAGGRRCEPVLDGSTVYLDGLPFNTTDTVYVTALKPAYYHCAPSAGTYGAQSGLTLDTDTVPDSVSKEVAGYAGLIVGWRRYSLILQANDRVMITKAMAEQKFREWNPNWANRIQPRARRLKPWGPRP